MLASSVVSFGGQQGGENLLLLTVELQAMDAWRGEESFGEWGLRGVFNVEKNVDRRSGRRLAACRCCWRRIFARMRGCFAGD